MKKREVEIADISCSYERTPVLEKISFPIEKGTFFIITGPNGSGKTTLLKNIAGLIKPDKGNVFIQGRQIKSYSKKQLAKIIAYVPQTIHIDNPFKVFDFVLMGRSPYLGMLGFEQKKDVDIAKQAISYTGIEKFAERRLDQLSGGEKQRGFIAKAICQQPDIILLDEPTASLDLMHQMKMMDLMQQLKNETNITVIMVSHDLNLASMYADKLLLLKHGKIVKHGIPEDVLTAKNLEEAYECKLLVDKNPIGGFPRITQVPGRYQ